MGCCTSSKNAGNDATGTTRDIDASHTVVTVGANANTNDTTTSETTGAIATTTEETGGGGGGGTTTTIDDVNIAVVDTNTTTTTTTDVVTSAPDPISRDLEDELSRQHDMMLLMEALNPPKEIDVRPVRVLIIFYTLHGHTHRLARAIAEGAASVPRCEVKLMQVPDVLTDEELRHMDAPAKPAVPVASVGELALADAIIFGCPSTFGGPAAAMKHFLDATGVLWKKCALVGKIASVFTSQAVQHGGEESVATLMYTQFAHHGMIIVSPGYGDADGEDDAGAGAGAGANGNDGNDNDDNDGNDGGILFNIATPQAGGPHGSSTYSDVSGERWPSPAELLQAAQQGQRVATVAQQLLTGRTIIEAEVLEEAAASAAAAGTAP